MTRARTNLRVGIRTLSVLVLFLAAGCSTRGYIGHRSRDAADILTVTLGVCDGVKVRAGPVHVGAVRASDLLGLRGGQFFANGNGMMYNEEKVGFFPMPRSEDWNTARKELDEKERVLALAEGRRWKPHQHGRWEPNLFGSEIFVQERETLCFQRGKNVMINAPGPFWVQGCSPSQYTQIEFSLGLLLGVRAGFNPGELLDFILGFTGADLYGDDVDLP